MINLRDLAESAATERLRSADVQPNLPPEKVAAVVSQLTKSGLALCDLLQQGECGLFMRSAIGTSFQRRRGSIGYFRSAATFAFLFPFLSLAGSLPSSALGGRGSLSETL